MQKSRATHKTSLLSKSFLVEFAGERVAFVPFYQHVQKQLCQEVLDFFFIAFCYKHQPVSLRLVNEKIIFDYFVSSSSKHQINIADNMRKNIADRIGQGNSEVFDGAFLHICESMATNFWISFTSSESFKSIDRRAKIIGAFDLKKALKKSSVPKYLKGPVLWFFLREEVVIPKIKLEHVDLFQKWVMALELTEDALDKQVTFVTLTILQLLQNDNDSILCKELIELFMDQPRIMYFMLRTIVEKNTVVDPATIDFDSNSELNSVSVSESATSKSKKSEKKKKGRSGKLSSVPNNNNTSSSSFLRAEKSVTMSQRDEVSSISHTGASGMLEPVIVEKCDPFHLSIPGYAQTVYRYYMLKSLELSKFRDRLKSFILEELFSDASGQQKNKKQVLSSISTILGEAMRAISSEPFSRMRLKMLLQNMYEVALPHYAGNKAGVFRALSAVLIEYIVYCVEYPVFIKVTLTDGARFKDQLRFFANVLRAYAFRDNSLLDSQEDLELYQSFLNFPVLQEMQYWISGIVTHLPIPPDVFVLDMSVAIEDFYEETFQTLPIKSIEYIGMHFISKRDLVKGIRFLDLIRLRF